MYCEDIAPVGLPHNKVRGCNTSVIKKEGVDKVNLKEKICQFVVLGPT